MIRNFKHKGLKELRSKGRTAKIGAKFHGRVIEILDALDQVEVLADLEIPGLDLHRHKGKRSTTWAVSVNGPWRITFEFDASTKEVFDVDFEQYH
ncbi:type II toxin-antitoxin system RelE/ParE family toxin [Microbaculum marinum]|uniref:Type II toxin-antitoxin system RelE/ParE family toxin n=1 Tax=Microbaculum marinum TaxID=1764581 RepID=A0AAW9RQN0_9HYPH